MKAGAAPAGPGVLNVRLVLLFLAQALATGATTSSTVLGSLIVAAMGHEALSGLPSTTVTLASALSAGAFGWLMLRFGRRGGLVSAYSLGAVGALVGFGGVLAHSLPVFLLGSAMIGAAQGGFQQGRYAAAESVPARHRGLALGLLMLASVLGSGVGTLLTPVLGVVAARLNTSVEAAGWTLAAVFLLLGALLTLAWRPSRAESGGVTRSAARMGRWPRELVWAAVAGATAQGLMVTLMSLTPLRAHHMGMNHMGVAGIVTGHITGMFGFGWFTGPLIDRLGVRFGYASGGVLLAAAAASALLPGEAAIAVSMFLLGLGWNLCALSAAKVLTAYRSAQGSVDALGYLLAATGTLVGGLVIAQVGFAALATGCLVVCALPVLAAWRSAAPNPSLSPAD